MSLQLPLPWFPPWEFRRFKKIDFFPPPPLGEADIRHWSSICIGTKTKTIGDALVLSTLPGKLKLKYPHLKIFIYPKAFNRSVFYLNPAVSGISYFPDSVFGDDANFDGGQLIHLKEQFFALPRTEPPRPQIFLSTSERAWASQVSSATPSASPICILHAWGHTWKDVASLKLWRDLVQSKNSHIRFWQVGVDGQPPIEGCERHFLLPRAFRNSRKLFALMSQAQGFIGVNSGPMHVARAFNLPSLILIQEGESDQIFARRRQGPYFLYQNFAQAFLYEENEHLSVSGKSDAILQTSLESFLSNWAKSAYY